MKSNTIKRSDRGLGIGDWGLPNHQSPIPNPHLINSIYYYIKYNDDKTYNIEY